MVRLLATTALVAVVLFGNDVAAQTCQGTVQRQNNGSDFCNPSAVRSAIGAGTGNGSGTVTSITAGTGLTGGTITTSGTVAVSYGTSSGTALQGSTRGAASGVASLDSSTKVPIAEIPSGTTSSSSTVPLNNSTRLNYKALMIDIGTVATATSTASPSAKVLFPSGMGTFEIPASVTPDVSCGANPSGTMTLVWKKNGSTTLCTMSLSTSCAVSSCSIANTSFSGGDNLTIESTADSGVTGLAFAIRIQHKD